MAKDLLTQLLEEEQQQPTSTDFELNQELPIGEPVESDQGQELSDEELQQLFNNNTQKPITSKEEDSSLLNTASKLGGEFVQGAADVVSSVPEAIADVSQALGSKETGQQEAFREAGRSIRETAKEIAPGFEGEERPFVADVARGLGSVAGFTAGGLAGAAAKLPAWLLPSALGAATGGEQQVQDYENTIKQQGGIISGEDREKAFLSGAALGTTEGLGGVLRAVRNIPLTKSLHDLDQITKGGVTRIISQGFKGGLEELTQEALQQLGSNLIASNIVKYDPDRNSFEGVPESGEVGFTTGAILNTLMASLGLRRAKKFEQLANEALVNKDIGELVDKPILETIAKDQNKKLLNPATGAEFTQPEVEKIFKRIINLDTARSLVKDPLKKAEITKRINDLLDSSEKEIFDKYNKTQNQNLISEFNDIKTAVERINNNYAKNIEEITLKEPIIPDEEIVLDESTLPPDVEEVTLESNILNQPEEPTTIVDLAGGPVEVDTKDFINQEIPGLEEINIEAPPTEEDIKSAEQEFEKGLEKVQTKPEVEELPLEEVSLETPLPELDKNKKLINEINKVIPRVDKLLDKYDDKNADDRIPAKDVKRLLPSLKRIKESLDQSDIEEFSKFIDFKTEGKTSSDNLGTLPSLYSKLNKAINDIETGKKFTKNDLFNISSPVESIQERIDRLGKNKEFIRKSELVKSFEDKLRTPLSEEEKQNLLLKRRELVDKLNKNDKRLNKDRIRVEIEDIDTLLSKGRLNKLSNIGDYKTLINSATSLKHAAELNVIGKRLSELTPDEKVSVALNHSLLNDPDKFNTLLDENNNPKLDEIDSYLKTLVNEKVKDFKELAKNPVSVGPDKQFVLPALKRGVYEKLKKGESVPKTILDIYPDLKLFFVDKTPVTIDEDTYLEFKDNKAIINGNYEKYLDQIQEYIKYKPKILKRKKQLIINDKDFLRLYPYLKSISNLKDNVNSIKASSDITNVQTDNENEVSDDLVNTINDLSVVEEHPEPVTDVVKKLELATDKAVKKEIKDDTYEEIENPDNFKKIKTNDYKELELDFDNEEITIIDGGLAKNIKVENRENIKLLEKQVGEDIHIQLLVDDNNLGVIGTFKKIYSLSPEGRKFAGYRFEPLSDEVNQSRFADLKDTTAKTKTQLALKLIHYFNNNLNEDLFNASPFRYVASDDQIENYKKILERIKKGLKVDVDIEFIDSLDFEDRKGSLATYNRVENKIRIFGRRISSSEEFVKTLLHELVGHFGTRSVLGKDWLRFINNIIDSNPKLMEEIVFTTRRWHEVARQLGKGKDKPYSFIGQRWSKDELVLLVDEYIAEKAASLYNKQTQTIRPEVSTFIRRAIKRARHIIRKLFGLSRETEKLTLNDIADVVSKSYTRLFKDPYINLKPYSVSPLKISMNEHGILVNREEVDGFKNVFDPLNPPRTLKEEQERLLYISPYDPAQLIKDIGVDESEIRAVNILIAEGFGKTKRNKWEQQVDKIINSVSNFELIKKLSPLGKIRNPQEYERISRKIKGVVFILDKYAKEMRKSFKNLSISQKEQLFNFYTNANATTEDLTLFNARQRTVAVETKKLITNLGKILVDNGLLSQETYEKNKNAYLPIRYMKYLARYTGRGKVPSFKDYLKQRKNLSDEARAALGQIKDPTFLVPETLITLGRDNALFLMFDSLNKVNESEKLGWIIKNQITIGKKDYTLEEAEEDLQRYKDDLEAADEIGLPDNLREYLRERIDLYERKITELKSKLPQAILEADYKQLPKDRKRYGRLAGSWIHKDIYKDMRDTISVFYEIDPDDIEAKILGSRGILAKTVGIWKYLKVASNPPSWVRNFVSNFVLLDIATNTNSIKLANMITEEFSNYLKGTPSKYWVIGEKEGVFMNTFSSEEINVVFNKYKADYERLKNRKNKSKLANLLPFLKEEVSIIFEATSNLFGFAEGLFKVTAIRDHIEQWEKENNLKLDILADHEKEAVINEAVRKANEAVFDYSKVPNFIRMIRRIPLGSPFITFTYLAFPQILKSFGRRPQKFIKYMAIPYIMAHLFALANPDLDDDDYKELLKKIPSFYRDTAEITVLPFKDSTGNWVAMPYGYFMPWGEFLNIGLKIYNNFDPKQVGDYPPEIAEALFGSVKDLGFIQGPIATAISVFNSNYDPFTKREITTSNIAEDKFYEYLIYSWTLMAPPFLTSQGALGKALRVFNEDKNRFGQPTMSAERAVSSLFGVTGAGFQPDRQVAIEAGVVEREVSDLKTEINKIASNPNLSQQDKAKKIKILKDKIKDKLKEFRKQYG